MPTYRDLAIEQITKTLIECFLIAEYTGIYTKRTMPAQCLQAERGADTTAVDICNTIVNHFSKELLDHYSKKAILTSIEEHDLLPASYKAVQEFDGIQARSTVIEDESIPKSESLKITFNNGRSPCIYIHKVDREFVYWSMDFGDGYAERVNMEYSGSVIDGILESANG
jgi:hypothetical protein